MKPRKNIMLAVMLTSLTVGANATTVLFSDNFDVTANVNDPNSEIANPGRQGGSLATPTLGYLFTGNVQVGNSVTYLANSPSALGDDMLAAFNGRAYVNYNFSNQTVPIEITFRGLVKSTNVNDWLSFNVGSNSSPVPFVNQTNASAVLFRLNGGTELWNHGSNSTGTTGTAPGSNTWQDYKIVVSDSAGTGGAWGSGGSRIDYYSNGSFLGTLNLSQLPTGEGFIGFGSAGTAIVGIDNLVITAIPEPSAGLLGGLGLICLLRRKR